LAAPVLVAAELCGYRTRFAQAVDHVVRIDPDHGTVPRDLHHHVQLGGVIIQNPKAHSCIVQVSSHVEIGDGGVEQASGMVVKEDFAATGAAWEG
jgi:hypothetical protein